MPRDHREDFERRFLTALRMSLDSCDSSYDDRYSIARFAIHYEVVIHFPDGEDVPVWAHAWADDSLTKVDFSDTGFWAAEDELWEVLERESLDNDWDEVQEIEESEAARSAEQQTGGRGR